MSGRALTVSTAVSTAVTTAMACVVLMVPACPTGGLGQNDALGKKGVVAFSTETPAAFSSRLVVGSSFVVAMKAVDPKKKAALDKAVLTSSNEKVLTIVDGKVKVIAPGTAELIARGATDLDSIDIHAGKAGATTLVDGALLAVGAGLDARLPVKFATRIDVDNVLQVAAVDTCGGDMLDLHASTLETSGTPADVKEAAAATFTLKTQVAGIVTTTLKTPGLDDLAYTIKSIDPAAVDQVKVSAVSSDDQGNVVVWGRAFTDDIEVIGDLAFTWTSDPRVTIAVPAGLVTNALVSFPAQTEPADDRPAGVTAEVFGELGTVDLLAPGLTTVTSRGAPARLPPEVPATAGCGGQGACNPEAAVVVGALCALRGLRRLRTVTVNRRATHRRG